MTSAWELIRTRSPRHFGLRMGWNAGLTPTISVFIWRLLLQKVPVECVVQSRGILLASKCLCRVSSFSVESCQHLFVSSPLARSVWDFFDGWFPHISTHIHTCTDIALRLGFWWRSSHRALPCTFLFIFLAWYIGSFGRRGIAASTAIFLFVLPMLFGR